MARWIRITIDNGVIEVFFWRLNWMEEETRIGIQKRIIENTRIKFDNSQLKFYSRYNLHKYDLLDIDNIMVRYG